MPILYYLKNPPLTLATLGTLDEKSIKKMSKGMKLVRAQGQDGKTMLIIVDQESNIAYIKEIDDKQLEKMKEEKEAQQEEKRIQPAKKIPGRGGRPN